ncbi:hypothetical protein Scep_006582 [Stephania cephalantha]|uniref:DUF7642 domain-containing protein n=1 Tax=Stephania cephalantha TaxID=152367 RepID=A0AAP0KAZ2_9MAGN
MLSGGIALREQDDANELLLRDHVSEPGDDEEEFLGNILYSASFENLAKSHVQYDTIIWIFVSLLLFLAWGVGVLMLLYLPVRRYILQRDISSRRLYVTSDEIVYKVTRPFFLPFLGVTKIEKHLPLSLVIDIIIEQGCLQYIYGIHTFRIETLARGNAAPVDELQIQGISDPGMLRKVIVTEASKCIRGAANISVAEGQVVGRSSSMGWKASGSPRHALREAKGTVPGDLVLHKLEEVKLSVERIESLVEKKPQAFPNR